mmetsp:Transcript_59964/g.89042  ORF Transcript_59964/g.89042 Transcript_59964/m.89042 type:complete len:236 (+) Transcript_59964:158-865(+)
MPIIMPSNTTGFSSAIRDYKRIESCKTSPRTVHPFALLSIFLMFSSVTSFLMQHPGAFQRWDTSTVGMGGRRKNIATPSCIFLSKSEGKEGGGLDFDSLMVMDIVLFSRKKNSDPENALELGAIQEDGTLAPISAWTLESAFSESSGSDAIEFLVDEEDRFPGLTSDDVIIHTLLDESLISYGSRQVGGGKGPGNPHGEESELLYYVDRSVIEEEAQEGVSKVKVVINPELEILW